MPPTICTVQVFVDGSDSPMLQSDLLSSIEAISFLGSKVVQCAHVESAAIGFVEWRFSQLLHHDYAVSGFEN